jgi:hypothetical protein
MLSCHSHHLRQIVVNGIAQLMSLMPLRSRPMQALDIRVASNGCMVLPLALRRAMGLHGDTKISATFADGEVPLSPINSGVARARPL